MDAVREGVESTGWTLSGFQKTTSLEFEGRWEGESTRSAFLFFHATTSAQDVSIDVYLDETSRGLTGNLALVVDLRPLGDLGDPFVVLSVLGGLAVVEAPSDGESPLTLRFRLADGADAPGGAEVEVRFKHVLTREVIAAGASAVRDVVVEAVRSFERILGHADLLRYRIRE